MLHTLKLIVAVYYYYYFEFQCFGKSFFFFFMGRGSLNIVGLESRLNVALMI